MDFDLAKIVVFAVVLFRNESGRDMIMRLKLEVFQISQILLAEVRARPLQEINLLGGYNDIPKLLEGQRSPAEWSTSLSPLTRYLRLQPEIGDAAELHIRRPIGKGICDS